MSQKPAKDIIEVACGGCGRTQRVSRHKVIPCDGYTCSLSSCKQNADFKLPAIPDGWIRVLNFNAAGAFSGWITRVATQDELRSIERAKSIRDAGIMQMLRVN